MVDAAFFTIYILVFLRIISVFITAPVFFPRGTPAAFKIGFCAILAYAFMPGIDYTNIAVTQNMYFIMLCLNEILTGITLGYIIKFCFFSISFAGQLMDMQIGFSMMSMMDPQSGSSVTLLQNLMYWLGLIIYLILDGHHVLIKALSDSFNTVGVGKLLLSQGTSMQVIKVFINFFSIGLKIALPIVLILVITELILGLIARTVPQINVLILGLPIKIVIGLIGLTIALPIIIHFMAGSFESLPNIIKNLFKTLPVLIIFADDKTEEATPKKKSDARKKGQVPRSKEVGMSFTLIGCTLILMILGNSIVNNLGENIITFLNSYMIKHINEETLKFIFNISLVRMASVILPAAIPIMLLGIAANLIQFGFIHTKDTLKPDFKKLNPISGMKKFFSIKSLVELVKDLAIVIIVGYVGYKFFINNFFNIINFNSLKFNVLPQQINDLIVHIFFKITLVMMAIALADFIFQKFQYKKELKMTKQEVKEEFKQDEGDPQVKGRMRQLQRQYASKRMMQNVPDATVVIANPTHVAIALKYENKKKSAPIVTAKGMDNIAKKIKQIARENDVPIIENKPLAWLLYRKVELDSEIPVEMYEAVAEVIAIVLKLKKR